MSGHDTSRTVGALPAAAAASPRVPALLTRLVWVLWVASVGVAAAYAAFGGWALGGVVAVDGLTVVLWVVVTFFSGIVHSYSRRYMAGDARETAFFVRVFAFTLAVLVLAAAAHLALFVAAWLAMGLLMADLVGHRRDWPQARAAASLARRYFLASGGLVAVAAGVLWWQTGAASVPAVAASVGALPAPALYAAAGALVLAAMMQSALLPFHTWLLSSMTAPTPASALMHAGFVNAGGLLLVRFAPVVAADPGVMLAVVAVGAASALGGKLLKRVQTDVKGKLGCSTVGQMGFMVMQAGLGFFAAAIAHLVLHGCYKAYQFLSAGERVAHEAPASGTGGSTGPVEVAVVAGTALAGGALFAALTGKGTALDTGLLLAGLVVLTVLHAARGVVAGASLPTAVRYGAVPLVALPAIAVYAGVYGVVERLLAGLPAVGQPAELTVLHVVVAAAFLAVYLAIETGVHRRSRRLYVALLNAGQPAPDTLLTSTEEYDDH